MYTKQYHHYNKIRWTIRANARWPRLLLKRFSKWFSNMLKTIGGFVSSKQPRIESCKAITQRAANDVPWIGYPEALALAFRAPEGSDSRRLRDERFWICAQGDYTLCVLLHLKVHCEVIHWNFSLQLSIKILNLSSGIMAYLQSSAPWPLSTSMFVTTTILLQVFSSKASFLLRCSLVRCGMSCRCAVCLHRVGRSGPAVVHTM